MQDSEILHLSASELAQLSGRSSASFSRDFKTLYKIPAKQWLQKKCLAQAQYLLAEEHLSVTEVALSLGYSNVSHFIKAFKTRYGLTPKQHKSLIV